MALITFVCAAPSASWTPTHNPNYGEGDVPMIQRHQPVNLSDGGDVYSYNKGQSTPVSLKWAKMPTVDLITLLAFFATIGGAAHEFAYTDPDAVEYTARLANAEGLIYRYVESSRHEVALELEVS